MFSRKIIDTDAFMDMPQTSQCLYFHLALRADDDGFISSPKKIMRMINSLPDDMEVLIAKRFLITFESGVMVVKHWRIHNYIQSDRYNPTTYTNEKELLLIKENGAYSLNVGTPALFVSMLDTQDRLGKESKGKVRKRTKEEMSQMRERFDEFWIAYPRKVGKQNCIKWWERHDIDSKTLRLMVDSVIRYRETNQWKTGYIPNPQTFLNGQRWEDDIDTIEPVGKREFKSYKTK